MKPAPEITEFVHAIVDEFSRGDFEALAARWSKAPGVHTIGPDPAEFLVGHAPIMELLRRQREEAPDLATAMSVGRVISFRERGIGWFAAEVTQEGFERLNRMTGVVRLETGRWRLAQLHYAVAVTNEELFGRTLTTHLEDLLDEVRDEPPDVHPAVGSDGTVTVMFSDIEGSTMMTERLGDARWMQVLRTHNGIVRDAIAANGGLEIKAQGDGFMMAFSLPLDAVHAACEIHHSMESTGLRVRIGIHRGLALVEEDDFFGKTVILAARIAAQARGGETLVSDDVRDAVRSEFGFAPAIVLELKGLQGVYAMHPVLQPADAEPRRAKRSIRLDGS